MEEVVKELLTLVKIDSESKEEGKIAQYLTTKLKQLGGEVVIDDVREKVGGNGYNVIAKFKGKGNPILLNAHIDTVSPGKNITPIIEGNIIKSKGDTILGADDKAGVAIILEVLRLLNIKKIPHPPIEVVFTVCEEVGLLGVKNLDFSLLSAKYGYSLDSEKVDTLICGAPSQNSILVKIHGKEAHAGVSPELGISSIKIAAKAIDKLEIGRLDKETTCNVGKIKGGIATNIVPPYTEVAIEVRSHNEGKLEKETKKITQTFKEVGEKFAKVIENKKISPKIECIVKRKYNKFSLPISHKVVQLAIRGGKNLGMKIKTKQGRGGSDANVFNERGISVGIIGTGMKKVHSKEEYLDIEEFKKGVKLVTEIVKEAAFFN